MSIITVDWLNQRDACEEGVEFFVNNKLNGFPLKKLGKIKGDYRGFVGFIKDSIKMDYTFNANGKWTYKKYLDGSHHIRIFDANENLIFEWNTNGYRLWYTNDSFGKVISSHYSNGLTFWYKYDDRGNLIHVWDSHGFAYWQEFDSNNNLIHFYNSVGYMHRDTYDDNGRVIHRVDSNGSETVYKYDARGNMIYKKAGSYEFWRVFDDHNNIVSVDMNYGPTVIHIIDYYEDGQLRKYNELVIPWFPKEN